MTTKVIRKPGATRSKSTSVRPPQANVNQIHATYSRGGFTHVHILAHGIHRGEGEEDGRYVLALHEPRDPSQADYVDAVRLASLLRTPNSDGRSCHPRRFRWRRVKAPRKVR